MDKYIDRSGDKKYFSIIPHYITNHSTHYEQALYLVMKRLAGEEGTCWASAKQLAKRMRVSKSTVLKYRKKLLERGWIKKIGEKKVGQTKQLAHEFEIVDLWEKNSEYIENEIKRSSGDPFKSERGRQGSQERSSGKQERSSSEPKEETAKNKQSRKKSLEKSLDFSGEKINKMMKLFKGINPTINSLFANKTQREALSRLLQQLGEEGLSRIVSEILPRTNQQKYAPTITTPLQLEKKLGQLAAFLQRQKNNSFNIVEI